MWSASLNISLPRNRVSGSLARFYVLAFSNFVMSNLFCEKKMTNQINLTAAWAWVVIIMLFASQPQPTLPALRLLARKL